MSLSLRQFAGAGLVCGPAAVSAPGAMILRMAEGFGAGWAHRFAAILAAHGSHALSFARGAGDIFAAGPIREVDLRATLAALRAFAAAPGGARTGLNGWSRGAVQAALPATPAPGEPALGCLVLHAATGRAKGARIPGAAAQARAPDDPRARIWPGQGPRLAPGAAIGIERCAGPVFLSVGTAGAVWDPAMTDRLARRVSRAGRRADLLTLAGERRGLSCDRKPEPWSRLTALLARNPGG